MGVGVLQPWHLIIIVVIVLVIFGPGKLPTLGKAIGDSVRDFKKAVGEDSSKEPTPVASGTAQLEAGTHPCPNCHKPLPTSDRFCGSCGARTDLTAA